MYQNSLTPSRLFGVVLLLFGTTGMLWWLACLADVDVTCFDAGGLILLGASVTVLILSVLFLRRVKWTRLVTSLLLHLLGLALLATLLYTLPMVESTREKVMVVPFTLFGAGLLFVAILALHGNAMKADFAAARERVRRPHKHAHVMGVIGCLPLLLALGVWQIVPLIVAKPTIAVDYLTQANQANRPSAYDPNLNAAPHYERLFSQFTPLPETLQSENKWKSWPTDLDPAEYQALEDWATANDAVLGTLTQAARCPYWWFEMKADDGALSGIQIPYLKESRHCAWAVVTLAKYKACRGDVSRAMELLADLHMLGMHRHRAGTLVDQLTGLATCVINYDAVLAILGHCQVDGRILRRTLDIFAPRLPQIDVPRFSLVEYLYGLDSIQRAFTDDGSGNGRLIPGRLYEDKKRGPHVYTKPIPYLHAVRICLTHPDRRRTVQLFESYFAMVKDLARKTPWELLAEDSSYEERLKEWFSGNHYLKDGLVAIAQCIRVGWRGRVSGEAMVTVLSLLTYKAQEGRWPESLDQLVEAGLLSSIPMDPYSGAPLVYKVNGDDFTLYSVGEDFVDDGGVHSKWDDTSGGDHVFWLVPQGP